MPQSTKIHFYLVQIYILELNINGNINNITKSLWGHYTVICTSKYCTKNIDEHSYMELGEEQFIFGFSVSLY